MKARMTTTLAAMAVCLLANTAAAQGDPRRAEAEARYKEGSALFEKGRKEEARLKFEQAWAMLKKPGILFSLAKSEQATGHPVEAARHFREYLLDASTTDGKHAKFRAESEAMLRELEGAVVRIEVAAPSGTKVTVDNDSPVTCPLPAALIVAAGAHHVRAESGEKVWNKDITPKAGELVKLEVVFETAAVAPPFVPPVKKDDPPVKIADPPPVTRTETGSWIVPAVLAGVGVVGVGVGVGFGLASQSKRDGVLASAQQGPCSVAESAACVALQDQRSSANGLATGSVVAYVGGGIFLAGAVVAAVVIRPWETREVRTSMRLVPIVGQGTGGLSLSGSFE